MPVPAASTVSVQGFSWGAIGTWGILLTLIGTIVKQVNPWRAKTIDAAEKLRDDLLKRVEDLEKKLERKDAIHAAERALDRHKINNLTQCFDAVVLLLEAAPERSKEILVRVREMRAAQILAEASEKGEIHAAEIKAVHNE